ncbi:MAG TPA: histone deacetylase [Rubrobacteraceae bacterium]|nr:histone deacetylase [Rubrobacteraceae bacterium]
MRVYSDPASERHVNGLAAVEAPERFPAALAGVEEARRDGAAIERRPCGPAGEDALARVHVPAYLEHLKNLSAQGVGYLSLDTGLNEHSWEAACLASGAACSAVESALSGEAAFAIARPPGHHAGRATGMGFCLTNHAAVAAEHARSLGAGRVAVLDWDVHHGNGTQDIFYESAEVLYLSAHQSPFYPGTGWADEVGEGGGEGLTVNVPLPAGSGEEVWAAAFAGVFIPVLREFGPALILVSAGYDAHKNDPLGGMALEGTSFGRFAASLASLAREDGAAPLALVLEGGYNLGVLTEGVAATIVGVEEGEDPGWEYAGGVRPVEAARKRLAPFWEGLR